MTLDDVSYGQALAEVLALRAQAGEYIEALTPYNGKLAVEFFFYFERAAVEAQTGTLGTHEDDDYTSSSADFRYGLKSVRGKFGELKAITLTAIAHKDAPTSTFTLCDTKEDQANGRDFWHAREDWKKPYSVSVKSTEMEMNEDGFFFYTDWVCDATGKPLHPGATRLMIVSRLLNQGAWQVDVALIQSMMKCKPDGRTFAFGHRQYVTAADIKRYRLSEWAQTYGGSKGIVCYHPPLPQVTSVSD